MITRPARIEQSLPGQDDLRTHGEHCSIDPRLLAELGSHRGGQIRVKGASGRWTLFTACEVRDERDPAVVRAGLLGRRRLGADGTFPGEVGTPAADPTINVKDARTAGELIERAGGGGRRPGLAVLAPHGGDIELHTDDQARRVARRLAHLGTGWWVGRGWSPDGGALERWHITSADLDEGSFPGLGRLMRRGFHHGLAFHGFRHEEVLIGGTATITHKRRIRRAIGAALQGCGVEVRIAEPGDRYGGDDPCNIVNRISGGAGLQLEQGFDVRRHHWRAIADAVIDVYASALA